MQRRLAEVAHHARFPPGFAVGALGRLLSGLLYGVAPTDAATFGMVIAVTGAVAIAACVLPARRAAATDILDALRGE